MKHNTIASDIPHGTLKSYVLGFVISIILTLAAYFIVVYKVFSTTNVLVTIVGLAILQVLIQLLCFLHMASEAKPRWNMLAFAFMVLVVFILVVGTLWIMNNLNYNVMPQMNMDLQHQA